MSNCNVSRAKAKSQTVNTHWESLACKNAWKATVHVILGEKSDKEIVTYHFSGEKKGIKGAFIRCWKWRIPSWAGGRSTELDQFVLSEIRKKQGSTVQFKFRAKSARPFSGGQSAQRWKWNTVSQAHRVFPAPGLFTEDVFFLLYFSSEVWSTSFTALHWSLSTVYY